MGKDNLEKRVENLEFALVTAMAIIQSTLPAEAEDHVWRLMNAFYSRSSSLRLQDVERSTSEGVSDEDRIER